MGISRIRIHAREDSNLRSNRKPGEHIPHRERNVGRWFRIGYELDLEIEGVIPAAHARRVVAPDHIIHGGNVAGTDRVLHEHARASAASKGNQAPAIVVSPVPLLKDRDVIAGTITEVNLALEDTPELMNTEPYGEGWIVRMTLENPDAVSGLMDAAAYKAEIGE